MSDEIDNLISEVSTLIASVTRDFQDTRYAVNMGLSASTPNTSASNTTTTETTTSTHSDGEQSLQEINALCDDVDHNLRTAGIHLDGGGGDERDAHRERQQASAAAIATAQLPQIEPPVEYIDLSDTQNDTAPFSPPSSVSPAPAFPQPFVVDLCTPVRRRRSTTASRRSRLYQPRINSRIPIDIPMPMQMPPMYDDDGIIQIEVLSAPIAPPPPTQRKRKSKERDDLFKDSHTDLNDSDAGASSDILKCAVCMESAYKRQPTSTKCGHVFCRECILQALRLTHKCPLCNSKITERTLLRLYV